MLPPSTNNFLIPNFLSSASSQKISGVSIGALIILKSDNYGQILRVALLPVTIITGLSKLFWASL